MRTKLIALALATAASALAVPAYGQSRTDELRWEEAQRRFEEERANYERERARYEAARRDGYGSRGRGRGRGYGSRDGYRDRDDDRYSWRRDDSADWEPSRYYREDPRYQERALTAQDEVYRGSDGRYYCRRSDGTTGLVIGAGAGALIGRGIDSRGERTTGTVVGGVLGALLGREVERSQDMRCR